MLFFILLPMEVKMTFDLEGEFHCGTGQQQESKSKDGSGLGHTAILVRSPGFF